MSVGAAGIDGQLPKVIGEVTLIGTIFRNPVYPGGCFEYVLLKFCVLCITE